MKPPVPLFFTCAVCGHVHSETLQYGLGEAPRPLTCPACHRELGIDWGWVTDPAAQLGLISTER
ncbi:hypothetical protein Tamer19_09580 [Cupriavidus sp. TA19]|nr:hypothetical protein Tamer19_09580 [Cupriavidus sp. TA19]